MSSALLNLIQQFRLLDKYFTILVNTSDVFFAFLRREYDLYHGVYPPVIKGEPASITLR